MDSFGGEETVFDHEGSRSEFLKLLAEFGEQPAFLARARAPEIALDALLCGCETARRAMLRWPALHLAVLGHQVQDDWRRLDSLLADPESAALLAHLRLTLPASTMAPSRWPTSEKTALHRFLESADRFNRHWRAYIESLDLEPVNKPRRDYNQFYVLEKACAFGSERVVEGFEPLEMIDARYLYERFPLLTLPSSA